jgi:hypothetical protein
MAGRTRVSGQQRNAPVPAEAPDKPDVIVSWLQPDYGQLGRASESLARALVASGQARTVAYIEPVEIGNGQPARLAAEIRDGVHVYQVHGRPADALAVGQAVVETSRLERPLLLNCGVAEVNWWFHHSLSPWCSRTALVTHDLLHLWPGMQAEMATRLSNVRDALARAHDDVFGLAQGAITDLPGAVYVGHGCDFGLEKPGPLPPEPADLRPIPHPRALYFGALSVRVDARALKMLADSGVNVVLLGFSPSPEIAALIVSHPRVYLLAPRPPQESPPYLRHCDVGIVPHTDEPFTWSMEPHKVYNYSAAGLRSVLLNCACPPAFAGDVTLTGTPRSFVNGVAEALRAGPLPLDRAEAARQLTWASVARSVLAHMRPSAADERVLASRFERETAGASSR